MVDYYTLTNAFTTATTAYTTATTTTNQFEDQWWSTSTGTALTTATWNLWTTYLTEAEPPRISAEEQLRIEADRVRRREEHRRALAEQQRERAEANRRAEVLLREHLNGSQLVEFDATGRFYVEAEGRLFLLRLADVPREYEVGEDGQTRCLASYCIHHTDGSPIADTMLAQKLLIETDLAEFERVANITRYDRSIPPRTRDADDLDEDQMEDPAA